MSGSEELRFRISWIALALSGAAVLGFGLVVAVLPNPESSYLRTIAAASIGMGAFGLMITLTAFRRRERWAFFALWYYPIFWAAHLIGNLPPGKDHIHQVLFIALSLIGLLVSVDQFFPRRAASDRDGGDPASRR